MTEVGSEFARGWRIVAGSFLGVSIGVSSLYFYSLGIFIKPIAAEFGWGRGDASLGILLGTGAAALMSLPMGRLVDRVGSVKVAMVSLPLLAVGFVALGAFTTNLASFLLLTVILSALTMGSSPLPYTRLVTAAFQRHRGLALGITLAGTGMGAMLIPVFLTSFVSLHGWRLGYYSLGAVVVIPLPLLWWLLIPASRLESRQSQRAPLRLLIDNATFRWLAFIFFLASLAILGTLVHFVPMLTDWGLSSTRAGATAGVIGITAIGGRLLVGALLDRFAPLVVTAAIFLLVACGTLALGLFGVRLAFVVAVLLGLAIGAEVDLVSFLVGRYFPKPLFGQAYGGIYAAFLIGGAIGPAASGYLQQATGDYRASLFGAFGLLVTASLFAMIGVEHRGRE